MVFDCAEKSRTLHSAFVDHEDMIRAVFPVPYLTCRSSCAQAFIDSWRSIMQGL
jgi:hypothetical protein